MLLGQNARAETEARRVAAERGYGFWNFFLSALKHSRNASGFEDKTYVTLR